jgi:hypothetical protein
VRLLDAAWSEGRDITSDSVVYEVANSMRLNGKELLGKGFVFKRRVPFRPEYLAFPAL